MKIGSPSPNLLILNAFHPQTKLMVPPRGGKYNINRPSTVQRKCCKNRMKINDVQKILIIRGPEKASIYHAAQWRRCALSRDHLGFAGISICFRTVHNEFPFGACGNTRRNILNGRLRQRCHVVASSHHSKGSPRIMFLPIRFFYLEG